jgi:NDP-sugar pyrophosphorylase family protein
MNAMIFAAGLGTRLRPLTENCPKAMVLLDGKPLLEHIILKIKDYGVERIVVNVHHYADQIISFIEKNDFGVDIAISDEIGFLLDTGGGLKRAEEYFIPGKPILIHNVDVLSDFDISNLIRKHIESKALATLLVRSEYGNRAFMSYGNRLTGWRNSDSLEEKIVNSDFYKSMPVGFTGIHIVAYELLQKITEKGAFSVVDVYLRLAKDYFIQTYTDNMSLWMDLGTIDQLNKAQGLLNDQ